MKAISLWQPWATLITIGAKRFETRHWATSYRGTLAIHAAKRPARRDELNPVITQALFDCGFHRLDELPYGCIVCTVNLVDCEPTAQVVRRTFFKEIAATERHFGDYTPGRFAWQLDNVQLVDNIPARGSQGFWEWQQQTGDGALPSFLQGSLL